MELEIIMLTKISPYRASPHHVTLRKQEGFHAARHPQLRLRKINIIYVLSQMRNLDLKNMNEGSIK
jgi:hypothetical protein